MGVPSRMNIGQIMETQLGLIVSRWGNEFTQELNFYKLSRFKAFAWLTFFKT
ncbi:MAG: hypothetical protein ACTS4X_02035 [Candidatus Hodgkinia cicadicola]